MRKPKLEVPSELELRQREQAVRERELVAEAREIAQALIEAPPRAQMH